MMGPVSDEARTWGMACHLSALAGLILPAFGNILGPLVVWLIKGKEHPFVDEHGKEALNFQITMTILMAIATVTLLILIGFILLPALVLFDLVLTIIAGVRANNGETYRYPFSFRFIS